MAGSGPCDCSYPLRNLRAGISFSFFWSFANIRPVENLLICIGFSGRRTLDVFSDWLFILLFLSLLFCVTVSAGLLVDDTNLCKLTRLGCSCSWSEWCIVLCVVLSTPVTNACLSEC
ncbi:uncharacterized protein BO95DRAFT_121219 [Aspergillus brunneoviolaceus CBS 621.78]|uniref:Uncharacterized protein n=1 Tax=Aspergillus brunneoviolaceus CBS 621.78 TaxID=1450534 RepID=A0ACD1G9T5_9EURO|nr:hypothetical protein BO95DRAFT_121219 [Aspergillus brunneoviolaceus CBS 621.78]RAH46011.1 hypothetical protein BO95DRAFT_121219 [Aspergillus brunneoviolaceus CBS 621.78]